MRHYEINLPDDVQLISASYTPYFKTWTVMLMPVDDVIRCYYHGFSSGIGNLEDAVSAALADLEQNKHIFESRPHYAAIGKPSNVLDIF